MTNKTRVIAIGKVYKRIKQIPNSKSNEIKVIDYCPNEEFQIIHDLGKMKENYFFEEYEIKTERRENENTI